MSNKLFFIAIILMLGLNAVAQDFSFGFVVEPTSSWVKTDDTDIENDGSKLGFKFGVVGEKYINDNFAITGGLRVGFGLGGTLKHRYGGKLLPDSELTRELSPFRDEFPDNTQINYKVGVLELPVGFKMRSNQIGYLRYFAEFPILSPGFLTSAKAEISSSTPEVNAEKENVIKDVSTLFLNWGVGAGIEYEMSTGTSLVGGIYYHANLFDFTTNDAQRNVPVDNDVVQETEDSRALMSQLSLRIGVKF